MEDQLSATGFFELPTSETYELMQKFSDALTRKTSQLFCENGLVIDALTPAEVELCCTLAWLSDGERDRDVPLFYYIADSKSLAAFETADFAKLRNQHAIIISKTESFHSSVAWLCEANKSRTIISICLVQQHRVNDMQSVFISYTEADLEWAKWIGATLMSSGYEVVSQYKDFLPGSNFMQEMDLAVDSTDRTIAVLSPDYLSSKFGKMEWMAALQIDPLGDARKLVPIMVRKAEPKGLLKNVVYANLVGLSEESATAVVLGALSASKRPSLVNVAFPGIANDQDEFAGISSARYPFTDAVNASNDSPSAAGTN